MLIRFMGSLLMILALQSALAADSVFRIGSYNVENYLDKATETRTEPKSESAKAAVRHMIKQMQVDVLALQEMGTASALEELRTSLKKDGLDYPFSAHISGWDTNVHVAVLSKFPIVANRSHTKEDYLLNGRRLQVSRGLAELEIQVHPEYSFTLFTAHLKSKRAVAVADELEMRVQEARILREKIDARIKADPHANIAVLGDLNDTKDSPSTRLLIGRGRAKLVDTRPAEPNGDSVPSENPSWDPRNITWTHYYGKEDSYSRIDYILLNNGMANEWVTNETRIVTAANWGAASDHRPIVATIRASNQ